MAVVENPVEFLAVKPMKTQTIWSSAPSADHAALQMALKIQHPIETPDTDFPQERTQLIPPVGTIEQNDLIVLAIAVEAAGQQIEAFGKPRRIRLASGNARVTSPMDP